MTANSNASFSPPRLVARRAGAALVLTALATALGVAARLAAGDGESSSPLTAVWGAGTLASGVCLFMSARLISGTRLAWDGSGSPLSPALFGASGIFTAVSGICALVLYATVAPDAVTDATIEYGRRLSGVVGFATAGLALLVAARHQWKTGGNAMTLAAASSALIGLLMQAIWFETAQTAHRIGGLAFLIWLTAIGIALWRGWANAGDDGDGAA